MQPLILFLVGLYPNEQNIVTISIFPRSPVGLSDVRPISNTLFLKYYSIVDGLSYGTRAREAREA